MGEAGQQEDQQDRFHKHNQDMSETEGERKYVYPYEMKVYFENDRFVCYYLEQNTYRLYNLAIDYGFNRD